MAKAEFKPCPFCGNAKLRVCADRGVRGFIIGYSVNCEPDEYLCGVSGPIKSSERLAKIYWNRRGK